MTEPTNPPRTMYGSRLLGARRPGAFGVLAGRVRVMGGSVGALAALVLWRSEQPGRGDAHPEPFLYRPM